MPDMKKIPFFVPFSMCATVEDENPIPAHQTPIGPLLEPCWSFWGSSEKPAQHANRRGGFWRHGADRRPLW
jgi:hypothetical protein